MLTDFEIMANGSSPVPYFSSLGGNKYVQRHDLVKVKGYLEFEYLFYYKYHNNYYCCFNGSKWALAIKAGDYKRMKEIVNEQNSLKQAVQLSFSF